MAQGFAKEYSYTSSVEVNNGPNLDAFHRFRVSNVVGLFDSQMTYDLQPLVYEQITSGGGATITHDATERTALMSFAATLAGGETTMQSYDHLRYQPGKSQLIFISFNFIEHATDVTKYVGYSDGTNGIELRSNGTGFEWAILSGTTSGNQVIQQANWNLDKLDGTGPSGETLDVTKTQLIVIDFQAQYVGRVRVGFDIGGRVIYAHEYYTSNVSEYPWVQTANLPIRCGMTNANAATTTMRLICSSVAVEGTNEESPKYTFSVSNSMTAGSGARTHVMSIRPKTTFNGITNRSRLEVTDLNIMVTGANPIYWELCIGQALAGAAYNDVNATYSASEFDTAGTLSGSPAIVIASGYLVSAFATKESISREFSSKYPITLDAAGANRDLGTLTLLATGIGGTSAMRAAIDIAEQR